MRFTSLSVVAGLCVASTIAAPVAVDPQFSQYFKGSQIYDPTKAAKTNTNSKIPITDHVAASQTYTTASGASVSDKVNADTVFRGLDGTIDPADIPKQLANIYEVPGWSYRDEADVANSIATFEDSPAPGVARPFPSRRRNGHLQGDYPSSDVLE
ncbi:MAG: hypothetical protein M1816_001825 [Peltula sp. TS41687]|nr:MAG: hypothetical protein M1816_001825 [Peltula sp. TS41687]